MSARWWLLALVVVGVLITPFLIWGEWEAMQIRAWLESEGHWAWAVGLVLLCADLLLPIPGTVVMSMMGYLYGWFFGGVVAALGSVLAGVLGYGVCRYVGKPAALRLAGAEAMSRAEAWFGSDRAMWVVLMSRVLPVLPEAVACLAGLSKMPFARFFIALVCGSVPMGFVFSSVGALGREDTHLALTLSAILPLALFSVATWLGKTKR